MSNNVMPDMAKLCQIIEHYEGFSDKAYRDSGGVWTIGYGSTYNHSKNRKVVTGDYISREKATEFLALDIDSKIKQLNHYIKKQLSPDQSTALVDYVYNRGIRNMLRTKLDDLINEDPFHIDIKNQFLNTGLFDRLGNRLWGLGRRRRTEWHLYNTGQIKFDWKRW